MPYSTKVLVLKYYIQLSLLHVIILVVKKSTSSLQHSCVEAQQRRSQVPSREKQEYKPTVEQIIEKREAKNAALRKWRSEHKDEVKLYMKTWREERKAIEDEVMREAGLKK